MPKAVLLYGFPAKRPVNIVKDNSFVEELSYQQLKQLQRKVENELTKYESEFSSFGVALQHKELVS